MDVTIYFKNGRIDDYNNVFCIREECNIYLYIHQIRDEEPYTLKMYDIAMIKIKGGYNEHKEG